MDQLLLEGLLEAESSGFLIFFLLFFRFLIAVKVTATVGALFLEM